MCIHVMSHGIADRVQYRCDEQVFPPEELAVHCPGGAVREEPWEW